MRPLLREAGHEVFTPSLTGVGERAHLSTPLVDLTTHVHDVVNTILYEDLDEIVLLGFSYGGCVITASLDHVWQRLREVVYLDALVPNDGESAHSILGEPDDGPIELGRDWLLAPVPREYDDPAEASFLDARRTPHPLACLDERVRLSRPVEEFPFGRTYIKATADPVDSPGTRALWRAAERARSSSRWRYREIATNHMVASNRPEELSAILLELA